jgi:metallo-beta-lactamase family protein
MKLTFYGAAREVTGSNYLLEINGQQGKTKILIDCGLHQGGHYAEKENFEPFLYNPKEIKKVFITHSHLDHIGQLPKLYKGGFRGEIYSTAPTKDSAKLLLDDSEHILAEEAEREKQKPLYDLNDVEAVDRIWKTAPYRQLLDFGDFKITFYDAGHILGSAFILLEVEGKRIIFSGDLGNPTPSLMKPTDKIPMADYCLMESTYGDRLYHNPEKREDALEDVIENTVKSGGVLMIPAFAMERTQELLYLINDLVKNKKIPAVPVYIDSPLAIKLMDIYKKYESYLNLGHPSVASFKDNIFTFPNVHLTLTKEESKAINDSPSPKVIMAGSGMSNGGRILHHELRYLSGPKNSILFVGYQSAGTMGRAILDGAQEVRIFGETVPVKCKIEQISGYSAHADQEGLLNWLKPARESLKKVFLVHGEEESSKVLAQKIIDDLAINAIVPNIGESFEL